MVAAVRRIHRRHGIDMVSCQQLAAVLKGVTLHHIKEHGPDSILPNRKEPINPSLARALSTTPAGTMLGSKRLDWKTPLFLCLRTMFAVSMSTGFRKAEVALPNGEPFDDRRLRRSSVWWRVNGAVHADPSMALLLSMVPGRDYALIRPPRCTNDPDGSKFGTHPIHLVFGTADPLNAAANLRELEVAFPMHGARRSTHALFFTDATSYAPMTHSTVDTYLTHLLLVHMSAAEAEQYSFHSFRIGFATALLAAGCSHEKIQALARWRSEESILIYGRMDPEEYTKWISAALLQETSTITGRRLPFAIDADQIVATFAAAESCFTAADRTLSAPAADTSP